MKATVIEIDFNHKHTNGKDCVLLVTQGDPYQGKQRDPRRHFFWQPYDSDFIDTLTDLGLRVGDRVEYTVDSSQYKKMDHIAKIEGEQAPQQSSNTPNNAFTTQPFNENKDKQIARAVAVKAGVDLVTTMMSSGVGKAIEKQMETELVVDEVLKIAEQLEPYLTLEQVKEVAAEEPVQQEGELNQTQTGEDVPF